MFGKIRALKISNRFQEVQKATHKQGDENAQKKNRKGFKLSLLVNFQILCQHEVNTKIGMQIALKACHDSQRDSISSL